MTQMAAASMLMATELERGSGPPLLAVARYASDGTLASASVVDPVALGGEWRYGDVPGWAIPSQDPGDTNGGAR